MSNRIVLFMDNVNMGQGHDGLAELFRRTSKRSVQSLGDHELVMFLNRAKDRLKIMGAKGKVIGYLKMPKGQRIALEAIQYIPTTFGGNSFNYDQALQKALEQRLARRRSLEGPLALFRAARAVGVM